MKRFSTIFFALTLALLISTAPALAEYKSTFEAPQDMSSLDPLPPLGAESYWTGSANHGTIPGNQWTGGFVDNDSFHNHYSGYDATYGWYNWNGFAYSNRTNNTLTGTAGQFTAMPGSGVNGSSNYGICYDAGVNNQIYFGYESGNALQNPGGTYITNNAYAYHSMNEGDSMADRFGYGKFDNNNPGEWDNPAGTNADFFKLTIYGLDDNYERDGSVDFYLADYRFADNEDDYIVTDWTWVDLTSLGDVYGLDFELTSSDTGMYGMNTPSYFAIDSVPIPGAIWLIGSAMLCIAGFKRKRN